MKDDINLITRKQDAKKRAGLVFTGSVGLFFTFFVIAALLIVYSLILKSKQAALETQADNLRAQLSSLSSQKEKLISLSERLGVARKVISTRKSVDTKVSSILSQIPSNFSVSALTAKDTLIGVTLNAPSLSDFDNLLEQNIPVITKNKPVGLRTIEVGSFTQRASGYGISLNFYFGAAKKQ